MKIKSVWPEIVYKYRTASRGRTFTRREIENIVENERAAKKRKAEVSCLISAERAKIREQKREREISAKARQAMLDNPGVKMKFTRSREGAPVLRCQEFNPKTRKHGKFLKSIPLS